MNIEIANRLVALRKEKNLSQEALASELGISRQAVSKWERAEASPDTDNLILLARLYGMSLDELLKTDQEKFESGDFENSKENQKEETKEEPDNYVRINFRDGIHVKDGEEEVHVGWNGIYVKDRDHGDDVQIDGKGVFVNGREYNWREECSEYYHSTFPISVIVSVAYIFIGVVYNMWHPGWLIFGIIPIFSSTVSAIKKRDIMRFAFPVPILMTIGYFGFVEGTSYPYWLLLLTIPLYYSVLGYIKHTMNAHKKKKEENVDTETFD